MRIVPGHGEAAHVQVVVGLVGAEHDAEHRRLALAVKE